MFPPYANGLYSTGPIAAAMQRPRQYITDLIRRAGLENIGDGRAVAFVDVALIRQVAAWVSTDDRSGYGLGLRDAGSLANALRESFFDAVWFHKSLDALTDAAPVAQVWRDENQRHGWAVFLHPTYQSFAAGVSNFNPAFPSPAQRIRFDAIVIDVAWSLRWAALSLAPHRRID